MVLPVEDSQSSSSNRPLKMGTGMCSSRGVGLIADGTDR